MRNCQWHSVGSTSIDYGTQFTLTAHFECSGGSYKSWQHPVFKLDRAYSCKDGSNNFVPVGEHSGVSYSTPTGTTDVSVAVKFRYKGVVGSGDECRVQTCVAHVDSTSSGDFGCQQTVGAGAYQDVSRAFTLKPGPHTYSITLKAWKGLPARNMQ